MAVDGSSLRILDAAPWLGNTAEDHPEGGHTVHCADGEKTTEEGSDRGGREKGGRELWGTLPIVHLEPSLASDPPIVTTTPRLD